MGLAVTVSQRRYNANRNNKVEMQVRSGRTSPQSSSIPTACSSTSTTKANAARHTPWRSTWPSGRPRGGAGQIGPASATTANLGKKIPRLTPRNLGNKLPRLRRASESKRSRQWRGASEPGDVPASQDGRRARLPRAERCREPGDRFDLRCRQGRRIAAQDRQLPRERGTVEWRGLSSRRQPFSPCNGCEE